MAKLSSFPALLLLLLCFSSFFSSGLSRPISDEAADEATVDGISDWWFFGGFPDPKSEWPFVHPPLPSKGFEWPPKKKWPFVYPPTSASGNWPFLKPHFPCPWWPKKGQSVNVEIGVNVGDAPASSPSS